MMSTEAATMSTDQAPDEPSARAAVEQQILELIREGDAQRAAHEAIQACGNEVLSWIFKREGSTDVSWDIYQDLCLDIFRGILGFNGKSRLRTWVYRIAHRARIRYHTRGPGKNEKLDTALDKLPQNLSRLVCTARGRLATWNEMADRVRDLGPRLLGDEEQDLLILFVDREMSWKEIAQVMADPGQPVLQGDALMTEAARRRQQFQVVKAKLYDAARKEGLLSWVSDLQK